jgi:cobalamin biosynthesis protein CobD/CbiB
MGLLSLVVALFAEHFRPLDPAGPPRTWFDRWLAALERNLDAGEKRHGVLAWSLAVLPWMFAAEVGYLLLHAVSGVLALVWGATVLWTMLGFRQFGRRFGIVHDALRAGQLDVARAELARWRGIDATEFTPSEIAKVAIEAGLENAHRQVFGVIAWCVLLPAIAGTLLPGALGLFFSGPGGAVLYRLSTLAHERWGTRPDATQGGFGAFSREVFRALDWVPLRLTALAFAIVGDFEDALYCWRAQAAGWLRPSIGVVLASGAGAIGVRLGEALHERGSVTFRPELGLGDEADLEHLNSAVGLVWRALILWLLVIGLVTVASWVG